MIDPLYAQVIVWVGLALLLVLCLPFARIQKLVLEVCALALRVALLALLAVAVYLWFRPAELPVEVRDTLNNVPRVKAILPEPGTQYFGVCAASLLVIVFLPLLAILDVTRKLAGWRLRRLRSLAAESKVVEPPPATQSRPAPAAGRRVDRRAAAAALAEAGSRNPGRASNPIES
jgi:hypothetical protein